MPKLIAQGAEAKIFEENQVIIKDRFRKSYRHPQIDKQLRLSRTKREAKVLEKLKGLIPVPELLEIKDTKLKIKKINGKKLVDCFNNKYCKEIGRLVGIMHQNNIVHGDLTTSNMILSDENNQIYLIDFGLSFFSHKIEDKAVDLHLLDRALESRHHKVYTKAMKEVFLGYKQACSNWKDILGRFEQVQRRGRNKAKY